MGSCQPASRLMPVPRAIAAALKVAAYGHFVAFVCIYHADSVTAAISHATQRHFYRRRDAGIGVFTIDQRMPRLSSLDRNAAYRIRRRGLLRHI